jgi:hypothetical protein
MLDSACFLKRQEGVKSGKQRIFPRREKTGSPMCARKMEIMKETGAEEKVLMDGEMCEDEKGDQKKWGGRQGRLKIFRKRFSVAKNFPILDYEGMKGA